MHSEFYIVYVTRDRLGARTAVARDEHLLCAAARGVTDLVEPLPGQVRQHADAYRAANIQIGAEGAGHDHRIDGVRVNSCLGEHDLGPGTNGGLGELDFVYV